MEDNIKLSVIIPLYNKAKCIGRTLDSVLQQDYTHFEIVVVDDGSTDGSAEVVSAMRDDRIRLISQPNGGVSKARNHGAAEAQTDWLIFLDGDDVFLPGTLRNFADLAFRYPRQEVFVAKYVSTDQGRYGAFRGRKERVYEQPLKAMWRKEFYPHPGNVMCSRDAFRKVGGFDERMTYYEDFEFGARLLRNYSVVFSPFVCMEYVVSNNEARVKIHPLQRDYSYYLEAESLENRWLKNYCYRILNGSIARRKRSGDTEGAGVLHSLGQRKFGRYYCWIDLTYKVHRKLILIHDCFTNMIASLHRGGGSARL